MPPMVYQNQPGNLSLSAQEYRPRLGADLVAGKPMRRRTATKS